MDLKSYIRDIPDWPKKGIIFKDITPLWKDKDAFAYATKALADKFRDKNIDVVVGAEARGFLVGAAVAYEMGVSFVPVRKPGKLPYKTLAETYELEYGTDTIEIHEDAIDEGQNVLIIDDLIATGGTVKAMVSLIEKLKGTVAGMGFVVELSFLNGREMIGGNYDIQSLITY